MENRGEKSGKKNPGTVTNFTFSGWRTSIFKPRCAIRTGTRARTGALVLRRCQNGRRWLSLRRAPRGRGRGSRPNSRLTYNGPWSGVGRTPRDRRVHDMASAIDHEFRVHINPAIASVRPILEQLEAREFDSEADCQGACRQAQRSVPTTFADTLRATQQQENSGH